MAIFRSKSGKQVEYQSQTHHEDYKVHSSNIHDPILSAVNEAQPFEQANARGDGVDRRPSYLSHDSADLKDIFGQPIRQGDMSNPTRARNERPLDTIRAFEYAITGDAGYRDQLESSRLGWGFHEDFAFNNLIPGAGDTADVGASSRPNYAFNEQPQPMYASQNYSASSLKNENKKKKKGLFGRKK